MLYTVLISQQTAIANNAHEPAAVAATKQRFLIRDSLGVSRRHRQRIARNYRRTAPREAEDMLHPLHLSVFVHNRVIESWLAAEKALRCISRGARHARDEQPSSLAHWRSAREADRVAQVLSPTEGAAHRQRNCISALARVDLATVESGHSEPDRTTPTVVRKSPAEGSSISLS